MNSFVSFLKDKMHCFFYSGKLTELTKQKKIISDELRLAEKKLFKREISQNAFNSLNAENQRKLIELDAETVLIKAKMKLDKINSEESMKFTGKRKKKFNELLEEKTALIHSFNLTKKKFFSRKINEKTFKEINEKNQKKLIKLESRINAIYKEQAGKIVLKAEKKLSFSQAKNQRIKSKEISADLFNQFREGEID
jgi:hypothetical protein